MPGDNPPVLGVNGKVLIHEPNQPFKIWSLKEVYLGTTQSGVYVPKVDDLVINTAEFTWYKVISVDLSTYIATLQSVSMIDTGANLDDYDVILSEGPGGIYDTHRAYLDTTVQPFSLTIDARCYIHGTMASYAKAYRGTVSNEGDYRVISMFYDQQGNLLGDKIPLELVDMPDGQNFATKIVPPFNTSEDMPNGEIITIVVFSDTGHVVSKAKFLIERTSYIPSVTYGTKYVTHIGLKSTFLSTSDSNLIEYPVNVDIRSSNFIGVVYYSDGSKVEKPIDGNRFKIHGLKNFVSTEVGRELKVVVTYTLDANEVAYGTSVGASHHLSEIYNIKTVQASGKYAVRLFGFPQYISPNSGYRLKWFLFNLERSVYYDVTPHVVVDPNGAAFDPTMYGVTQNLNVGLKLSQVDGSFDDYKHSQIIGISLMTPATENTTNWTVRFEPTQNPVFGLNLSGKVNTINQNLVYYDISQSFGTEDEWLEEVYYNTRPLYNPSTETKAPKPTHFTLIFESGSRQEYPLFEWQNVKTLNHPINNGSNTYILFTKRIGGTDIMLGMSCLVNHEQP